jgi:multidrug efflux pump subunit AcrA (membrane-fusion protein)
MNMNQQKWRTFALPLSAFLLGGAMALGWQGSRQPPAVESPIMALPSPVVQVAKPERRTVVRSLELPGDIRAYQQARLYAKVAGYLEKVLVDKGDRVKAGQLLALIQAPELEREVLVARQAYQAALAKREVERPRLNCSKQPTGA